MNHEEAVAAIIAGAGKTRVQAEAFLALLGSAFRRRGRAPGEPLSDEAVAREFHAFMNSSEEGNTDA